MAKRKNPCEFCEDDQYGDYKEHQNGYCMWYEFYPYNGLFSVICQANDENGELIEDAYDFNFDYCPMCGKKLLKDGG